MSTDLEDRLRRGLHSAAREIPTAPTTHVGSMPAATAPSRRWLAGVVGAAAVVVVVGAVLVLGRDGNDDPTVRMLPSEAPVESSSTTESTAEPPDAAGPAAANGMVPGRAVLVDPGSELRTYGPDGSQTGTVSLALLDDNIQAVSSDLNGGWVACGEPRGPETDNKLVWFPASGQPVTLQDAPMDVCAADAVRVVNSPDGPTAVYSSLFGPLQAVVLSTGAVRDLGFPTDDSYRWSASTGRVISHADETGFTLYDLATGLTLPMAAIDVVQPSDVALAPDAASVAVLTGSESVELTIYDLATGTELFRESFDPHIEGVQLSYDGTTVAVGSYYEGNGRVAVIDLPTGDRHTIDAYGLVL